MYRTTDAAVDTEISALFASLVGGEDRYSVIGANCRDFAQGLFNMLRPRYPGGLPAPHGAAPGGGMFPY
jgi:hypothetical protein